MKTFLSTAIALATLIPAAANAGECKNITEEEIIAAQKEWAEGIVKIGVAEDAKNAASDHIDELYAYEQSEVLFKPTKAAADQFRGTKDEAHSYFVKGKTAEDKGFALAPYTMVRFENEGIIIDCDSALAMGNYYFTTVTGDEVKVEYTFGYIEDEDGKIRINLHHSSLPYNPS